MQNNEVPDWYFSLCTWLIASRPSGDYTPVGNQSWYTHWDQQFGLDGRLPIVDALKGAALRQRVWRLAPTRRLACRAACC
ncbi:hypothetical protein [Candidatus Amarolinea dominans]|uniref:hypothetical protein n=1 Tax=Candidatus Amarolinea dominans TaxID=3140696 RepID=UPI003136E37C|nr:hypothetical protein [Anaerolineae bacterium]